MTNPTKFTISTTTSKIRTSRNQDDQQQQGQQQQHQQQTERIDSCSSNATAGVCCYCYRDIDHGNIRNKQLHYLHIQEHHHQQQQQHFSLSILFHPIVVLFRFVYYNTNTRIGILLVLVILFLTQSVVVESYQPPRTQQRLLQPLFVTTNHQYHTFQQLHHCTIVLHPPTHSKQPQQSFRRRNFISLLLSSHSSSVSATTAATTTTYEQYTVKELRDLIRNIPSLERGTLSKLQKKQDLVNFLDEYYNNNNNNSNNDNDNQKEQEANDEEFTNNIQHESLSSTASVALNGASVQTVISTSRTKSSSSVANNRMAPLQPTIAATEEATAAASSATAVAATTTPYVSPKDTILEEVYTRYPPVRDLVQLQQQQLQQQVTQKVVIDGSSTDEDTNFEDSLSSSLVDIRQIYHPIFQNRLIKSTTITKSSSDEDDSIVHGSSQQNDNTDASSSSSSSTSPNPNNIFSSSDMDLIFVGTASCTPGVTRGTSCTALRLNWQRTQRVPPQINVVPSRQAGRNAKKSVSNQQQQQQHQSYYSSGVTSGTWLFDVGECTQLQIQRTASIKPSKINKIFITHAHGDHSFGLPGLLCIMGTGNQNRDVNNNNNNGNNINNGGNEPPAVVEIYGPQGLRMWLRVAIRYSVSRIVPPYVVHELMDIPMAPEWEFNNRFKRYYYNGFQQQQMNNGKFANGGSKGRWGMKGLAGEDPTNWISQAHTIQLERSSFYGEMEGGRDIYPEYNHPKSFDGAPVWNVIQDDTVNVYAAPMSHTIPCVGYCIDEAPRPGRLRNEYVEPIVQRNLDALRKSGFQSPMKVMGILKNLKPDTAFTFPDGTVVTQTDAVEAPRRGRKIVICGDTCDSRAMIKLGQDADIVIHEATNSYLPGVDTKKDLTSKDVTRDCIIHGHSTPQMAGEFCRAVNGKLLILNHFSARYKGDVSADSLSIMMRIEKLAMKASGLNETEVAAAWDFMILPIPQHE